MAHSDKNTFSAADLCKILLAAGESGVKRLKMGDLEVDFVEKGPNIDQNTPFLGAENVPKSAISSGTMDTLDPELMEDMRVAQLMIDDPVAYEQEIIDAHISGVAENAQI